MYQTIKDGAELLLVLSPFDIDPDGIPVTDDTFQEDVCVMDDAEHPHATARNFASHMAMMRANPWPDRDGATVRLTDNEYNDIASYPAIDLSTLMPTPHDARTAFASLAIRNGSLELRHVRDLEAMMDRKFARLRQSDTDPIRSTWRMAAHRIQMSDHGHIAMASLRMASSEFEDRECVTFNRDGFVGMCGWASSANAKPIASTFIAWCVRMQRLLGQTAS